MRKLHRGIAAGLLSAPLVLGLSGVASAAEDSQGQVTLGDDGVSVQQTHTGQSDQNPDFGGHRYHPVGNHGAQQDGNQAGDQDSGDRSGDHDGGLLNLLF